MTRNVQIGRWAGLSVPLLMAILAALTVAGLARSQSARKAAPAAMVAVAPAVILPERPAAEPRSEARPIRYGVCLYSAGDDETPADDPDQWLRPRDRTGEPAQ